MQLLIIKNDRGSHKKGDIIEVRASGTPFGGKEPDYFVLVDVPGVPMAAYEKYNLPYETVIDFEVVSSDLDTDTHRIRIYSEQSSDFLSYISADKIRGFIESWNGVYVSHADGEVIFDMKISDALSSRAFWGLEVSKCTFEEIAYSSGVHRIRVDYTGLANNPTYVEKIVAIKGLEVISHSEKVLIFDGERTDVRNIFQDDIKEKSRVIVTKRRYHVPIGVVNTIVGNGGTYTATETMLLNNIMDKTVG